MENKINIKAKPLARVALLIALLTIVGIQNSWGATRTASVNGNWSSTTTWGGQAAPTSSDDVVIPTGITVGLDVTASCATLSVSGTFTLGTTSTARTLSVSGNVTINSGGLIQPINLSATQILNIGGNFTNNGSFNGYRALNQVINTSMNGTISQTISGTPTRFDFYGLTISNTTSIVSTTVNLNLAQAGSLTIPTGAVFYCGTSIITHSGTLDVFTLSSGGTLGIGSPAGITTSGGTGNIQTSSRSYNSGANYIYNGTAAQVTGNGLPSSPASLSINNTSGVVTLSAATSVSGAFAINGSAKVNLGTGLSHTATTLQLYGIYEPAGTWGGNTSAATNKNPIYFADATGILTISNKYTFTATGSGSWTCPAGITSITVECWGGGGKGGTRTSNGNGGGGGGGAYSNGVVTVVPGNSYSYTVGSGATTTAAGGDSWFSSATTVMAKGGGSVADNTATGAAGGAASSGYPTSGGTRYSGGTGVTGASTYGGGGGSSAGTGADGNTGSTYTGGTAPTGGGNGGDGRNSSQGNGLIGLSPGGGGGGSYRTSSQTRDGGSGANGQIIINLNVPTYSIMNSQIPLK